MLQIACNDEATSKNLGAVLGGDERLMAGEIKKGDALRGV